MNLPTILAAVAVAVIFIAIVAVGIRNRRAGKTSCACGGDCGSCSHCGH